MKKKLKVNRWLYWDTKKGKVVCTYKMPEYSRVEDNYYDQSTRSIENN